MSRFLMQRYDDVANSMFAEKYYFVFIAAMVP